MYNYLVEFVASAFVTYVVFATANPLAIGFAHAFALLLTQKISEGHVNPVVPIVMTAIDKMSLDKLLGYIFAQIFGGFVGYQIFIKYRIPV
jgi:glycerol uptake facilitator-like aquaporin